MAIIPTIFLCLFFRQIKSRTTRTMKVQKLLLEKVNGSEFLKENLNSKNMESKYLLPCWFKIIVYLISFTCMSVAITLTFIKGKKNNLTNLLIKIWYNKCLKLNLKGLEFGNEKVKSWLISLIISFLIDVIITLPLQVKKSSKYNKHVVLNKFRSLILVY